MQESTRYGENLLKLTNAEVLALLALLELNSKFKRAKFCLLLIFSISFSRHRDPLAAIRTLFYTDIDHI